MFDNRVSVSRGWLARTVDRLSGHPVSLVAAAASGPGRKIRDWKPAGDPAWRRQTGETGPGAGPSHDPSKTRIVAFLVLV
jgi:hypothetical protein